MAPNDRWFVKQILSGDRVVLRGQPRGGPPPELTFALSNLTAPKLARRPGPQDLTSEPDEPWAWEAREYLRKKLIGKEVTTKSEYQAPNSTLTYGYLFLGKDPETAENIAELLVKEGLVEVRRAGKPTDELQRLIALEEEAKTHKVGKWSDTEALPRNLTWNIENLGEFMGKLKGQQLPGIVEFVRDCSTLRLYLLAPHNAYITVQLTGIKGQASRPNDDGTVNNEPFAEEAKFFVESRLLHRDVKVVLEGVSSQTVALGTVLHPNGNISEMLLGEGFAKCIDWTIAKLTSGIERYRAAEKHAKERRVRIWKDYQPPSAIANGSSQSEEILEPFDAKVIEVVNGDALVVKPLSGKNAGKLMKVHLAGLRPPKLDDFGEPGVRLREHIDAKAQQDKSFRFRPLYDIPFMFQAREFIRKKLIGKKVTVKVDYVQPPTQGFPDRLCCTVTHGTSMNIGEAVVALGLATVVRYKQDDSNRPSNYDGLRQAEEKAKAKNAGIHKFYVDSRSNSLVTPSNRTVNAELPQMRVVDISGDAARVRQYFPFFERAGTVDGIVEFVANACRVRVYVPKESCVATLLLSGVDCPMPSRPSPRGGGAMLPAEPFGEEACLFLKEAVLHHDVKIKVDTYDRGGNLIGWLFVGQGEHQKNMSLELVAAGFARVHSTADRSQYYQALKTSEEKATAASLKIWSLPQPEAENNAEVVAEPEPETEKESSSLPYKPCEVLKVSPGGTVSLRYVSAKDSWKEMVNQLNSDFQTSPPLAGAYTPRKGDLCAYRSSMNNDPTWERARVDGISGGKISINLIDSAVSLVLTSSAQLASLPEKFRSLPSQATEAHLAAIRFPKDEEYRADAVSYLDGLLENTSRNIEAAVVSKMAGIEYIVMHLASEKSANANGESSTIENDTIDVGQSLLSSGFVTIDRRGARRQLPIQTLRDEFTAAQNKAREHRINVWRYGHFEEDGSDDENERPFRR